MKHIKQYNELKEIIQNIKDICLELSDEGFIVEYNLKTKGYLNNTFVKDDAQIKISKLHEKEFEYKEISEVIERLTDYMKSVGYLTCPYYLVHRKATQSGFSAFIIEHGIPTHPIRRGMINFEQ